MRSILELWQEATREEKNLIVILNGPPGTGKDTIADILRKEDSFFHASFKVPLMNIVNSTVPFIDPKEWEFRYADQSMKNEPWDKLGGLSQREYLIKVGEEWIKPVFGSEYFGALAGAMVLQELTVFSDGGFDDEIRGLKKEIAILEEDAEILIIHLHREGHDFSKDSRSYLTVEGSNIHYATLHNLVEYSPEVERYLAISDEDKTFSLESTDEGGENKDVVGELRRLGELYEAERQENLDRLYTASVDVIETFIQTYKDNNDI